MSDKPIWDRIIQENPITTIGYGGEDVVCIALAIHNGEIVGWRDINDALWALLEAHKARA